MNLIDQYSEFCAAQRAKDAPMKPTYKITALGGPCLTQDLESRVIAHVDSDHAEPLRALAIGEEYEIPQMGAPNMFVTRIA